MYPGLFILSADNISISEFKISGNLGADGNGANDSYKYDNTSFSTTYSIFVDRVFNAGDPSINKIYILEEQNSDSVDFSVYNGTNYEDVQ